MEARQMGYTNLSPEQIFVGIKDSYPFHPCIRDLMLVLKKTLVFSRQGAYTPHEDYYFSII